MQYKPGNSKMTCFKDIPFELVTSIAGSIDHRSLRGCSCMAVKPRGCDECPTNIGLNPKATLAGERKVRSQTLAALCLTSRRLNAAATRALYSRPATEKWWLLFRTLLARPDLAQLVDKLCFPDSTVLPASEALVSVEVLSYYRTKRDARQRYLAKFGGGVLNADNEFEQTISVVASLCPAVKTLEARIGYFDMFYFCAPLSMLALHTVEVAHYDDRYSMNMGQMVPLFKAALNLKTVRCRTMSNDSCGDPGFTLPNVTTLDLQDASIHADAL